MLQSFQKIVGDCEPSATIAYVGIPFTCTPIIDFLVYVTRGMFEKAYYIPAAEGDLAYELVLGDHRVESRPAEMPGNVDVLVLMGGISMPQKWDLSEAKGLIGRLSHDGTSLIGVCFMDMFKKSGWIRELPFDYVENCYLTTDAYKNNSENKYYSQSLE